MSEEEEFSPTPAEIVMYYVTAGLNGVSLIIYIILFLQLIIREPKWSITVQFIVQMVISSIIHSLAYLVDFVFPRTELQCLLQSIFSQYSVIVHVFILTSIFFIALALFKIPDKFEHYRNIIRLCLILFCWVLPTIFIVAMNYDFYYEIILEEWEMYYCWSESKLSVILFPVISFIGYTACMIVTCTLQNTVRIAVSTVDTSEFEDKYDQRLISYALVMWISFVLTVISVIWTALFSGESKLIETQFGTILNDVLTCICTVGENLMFPIIMIVFWFNSKRWNRLMGLCCNKKESLTESQFVGRVNLTVGDVMINDAPDD